MPLELKEVMEYLGSKADSIEDFKKEHAEKFYTEEQLFKDEEASKKVVGRQFGAAAIAINRDIFKKEGIELTGDDLKNPIEKIVSIGVERIKKTFTDKITELQSTDKLAADERVKAAEGKYAELHTKYGELETVLKTKAEDFEKKLTEKESEVKTIKLNTVKEGKFASLPWLPDIDPYKKKGFLTEFNEEVDIRFDDDGTDYPVDRKTGQRFKSSKNASAFMTTDEVILERAVKAKVVNIAPNAGKSPSGGAFKQPEKNQQPGGVEPKNPVIFANRISARQPHPSAIKAAEQ